MGGQSMDVKVWDEDNSEDRQTMGPRLCPVCGSLGTGRFMHEHIEAEHAPRPALEPRVSTKWTEPSETFPVAKQNRWAAFTDEEIQEIVDLSSGAGWEPDLVTEARAEQTRRRS